MTRLIVGLFDTREEAERVRQELIQTGFSDQQIQLTPEATAKSGTQERGFWDDVRSMFGLGDEEEYYTEASRRGHTLVRLNAEETDVDRAITIMDRHGAIDIDQRAEEWRKTGWQPTAAPTAQTEGETTIPVTEEQLKTGARREQRGGVRVYTRAVEQPVEQDIRLRDEHAHVERRAVDRPAGADAFEEQSVEVRETHEEPVVHKEARVVEEVAVGKDVEERTETVRDTVRHTEVDIQDLDDEFRRDYEQSHAGRGTYEQYQPAYRLGAELANDNRFRDEDWSTVAPSARQTFSQRNPGQADRWNEFEDAVHRGFDGARRRVHAHS